MPSITVPRALPVLFAAALLSMPLLAVSAPAQAQTEAAEPAPAAKHAMAKHKPADRRGESIEQRIDALHASLQITSAEDAAWQKVAQVMRDNESAQLKLQSDRTAVPPASVTAMQHLQNYQDHMQLHLDGLKNLTSAFDTLYGQMPAPQKLVADRVFRGPNDNAKPRHG